MALRMNDDITLLTPAQAARILGVTEKTLRNWRSQRIHLPYIHIGGRVRYRRADLKAWIDRNTTTVKAD